jgi:multiple sugar transport system ATP-binding protein
VRLTLQLSGVRKSYGDTLVLDDVSLTVAPREFIAFLGPSGSGKSTLLRIIAGLERADAGEIVLDGQRIDQKPPGERGVAMVFQHYALYPHMSVRENMAFGLKNARVSKGEIDRRIADAAGVLQIEELLDRSPAQMSGGQRQRVAIGRALVKEPKLFLLDEPLSNLDAALRLRTRVELAQLKQRVDAAVIMVTHDQAEAMTLADRIVVMSDRRIQQVGAPMEIYSRPANTFVAQFVGSPTMTLLPAQLVDGEGPATLKLGDGTLVRTPLAPAELPSGELRLGLRPEAVRVGGDGTTKAKVELVERLGERTLVYARLADGQAITAEAEGDSKVKIGDEVPLSIDGDAVHLFGPDGTGYHGPAA